MLNEHANPRTHYEDPLGAFFCHAKNINTNGMVMTAVAIRTGWNALGSMSSPASCIKGIGKTVKSQNAMIIANKWKLRFISAPKLSRFTFFLSQLMHFVVEPEISTGTTHEVHTLLSQ